jgi:hypothetical protein
MAEEEERENYGDDEGNRERKTRKSKRKKSKKRQKIKKNDYKYVEKVLGKDARKELPGHDCAQCRKFYEVAPGLADHRFCNEHSKHRAATKIPQSPEGYWGLSMNSQVSLAPPTEDEAQSIYGSQESLASPSSTCSERLGSQ